VEPQEIRRVGLLLNYRREIRQYIGCGITGDQRSRVAAEPQ
jgi:hypothetical protein